LFTKLAKNGFTMLPKTPVVPKPQPNANLPDFYEQLKEYDDIRAHVICKDDPKIMSHFISVPMNESCKSNLFNRSGGSRAAVALLELPLCSKCLALSLHKGV
jgi:hypothetical protein